MFVKPNPEKTVDGKALEVFDPVRRDFIPEEGREVPNNAYWLRRLQTADVVRPTATENITAPESEKAKTKGEDGQKNTAKGGADNTAKTKGKAKAKKSGKADKQGE